MAKRETYFYGLKPSIRAPFRRTVVIGKGDKAERVQLVFEPNTPLELSAQEVAGLKADIADGIIVAWNHGKPALERSAVPLPAVDAELLEALKEENAALKVENAELSAKVGELTEQIEELTEQIEELTAPDESDDDEDDTEVVASDAPLGDE